MTQIKTVSKWVGLGGAGLLASVLVAVFALASAGAGTVGLTLVVLKLVGVLHWVWLAVLAPWLFLLAETVIVILLIITGALLGVLDDL